MSLLNKKNKCQTGYELISTIDYINYVSNKLLRNIKSKEYVNIENDINELKNCIERLSIEWRRTK